jgi:hypothetical protein
MLAFEFQPMFARWLKEQNAGQPVRELAALPSALDPQEH